MAQTQSSKQPILRGFTVKQNKFLNQNKCGISLRCKLVMKPRWTSRAILPFIYHCIITHGARAWGPGLVASRADKIFFLPYSQTQSSKRPFLVLSKEHFVYLTPNVSSPRPYPLHTSCLMSLPTLAEKKFPSVKKIRTRACFNKILANYPLKKA